MAGVSEAELQQCQVSQLMGQGHQRSGMQGHEGWQQLSRSSLKIQQSRKQVVRTSTSNSTRIHEHN
jgi:hypothetical protein